MTVKEFRKVGRVRLTDNQNWNYFVLHNCFKNHHLLLSKIAQEGVMWRVKFNKRSTIFTRSNHFVCFADNMNPIVRFFERISVVIELLISVRHEDSIEVVVEFVYLDLWKRLTSTLVMKCGGETSVETAFEKNSFTPNLYTLYKTLIGPEMRKGLASTWRVWMAGA